MRSSALLLALAIPPLVATPASAGPIRVTYQPFGGGKTVSTLLPEDFAAEGFAFTLDQAQVFFNGPGWTEEEYYGPYGPPVHEGKLESHLYGWLTFDREPLGSGRTTALDSPAIRLNASLTGPMWSRSYGAMWGEAKGEAIDPHVELANSMRPSMVGAADYERWERDLGIPRAFLEYLATPGVMKLSATITGGSSNMRATVLTVAPMPIPAPVPEPASWAAWGLAVVGAWAMRRRRAA